ncbi:MAG TPA: hypothetical protein VIE89_01845, partial [Candidatus Binatia bacterium]
GLISIWKAHLQTCATDTNEHEKSQTPTLSIEALRNIGRIVGEIKTRLDANGGNQDSSAVCTPDTGSRRAASPLGSKDIDSAKKEK